MTNYREILRLKVWDSANETLLLAAVFPVTRSVAWFRPPRRKTFLGLLTLT